MPVALATAQQVAEAPKPAALRQRVDRALRTSSRPTNEIPDDVPPTPSDDGELFPVVLLSPLRGRTGRVPFGARARHAGRATERDACAGALCAEPRNAAESRNGAESGHAGRGCVRGEERFRAGGT